MEEINNNNLAKQTDQVVTSNSNLSVDDLKKVQNSVDGKEQKPESNNVSGIPLAQKKDKALNPFLKTFEYLTANQKRKTYTLMSITFAFIAILVAFAIFPTVTSITQIVKKIEEYKVIQDKQTEKLSNIYNLKNLFATTAVNDGLNEYVEFLDTVFLPTNLQEEDIYKNILNITKNNAVVVDTIATQNTVTTISNTRLIRTEYQVTIRSNDLSKIQKFISDMNSSPQLYNLDRLTITPPTLQEGVNKGAGSDLYTCIINLFAYNYV